MNFFHDQRLAKKKTKKLIALFFLITVGISVTMGLIITITLGISAKQEGNTYEFSNTQKFDYSQLLEGHSIVLILIFAGLTFIAIFLITLFKTLSLKRNPAEICQTLGAKLVPSNPNDLKLKQYQNIVEEMSIASSVPKPLVYILEDDAINAFACGYDINSAAICVTTGTLDNLSRDELQAVVAHEYSHILNGDMNINLRLIAMLAGILFLYYAGSTIIRSQRYSRSKNGNQAGLIGVALIILGLVGFLFGKLLKAAISRQREYLADASSVQFTRNKDGMTGALKKIAVHSEHGILQNAQADKASHMYLVEGLKKSFFSFSTHPPLYDRIKAVDKSFNPQEFEEIESKKIMQQMMEQRTKPIEDKKQEPKFERKLEILMPLFLMLKGSAQNLGDDPEVELLRRFVANEDPEIKNLSYRKRLEVLELAFGQIKSLPKPRRENLYEVLKTEMRRDGKVDFEEFLIFSYLRPALKDVKIQEKKLSTSDFNKASNRVLNFLWYMDKIELTNEHKKELSEMIPFSTLKPDALGYNQMFGVFESLRFSSLDQKEKLLHACEKLIHINQHITEKEEVVLKIIKQILGVPGASVGV